MLAMKGIIKICFAIRAALLLASSTQTGVTGCSVMLIGDGRCQNIENIGSSYYGSSYCLYTRIIRSKVLTTCNSNISNSFYWVILNKKDKQCAHNITRNNCCYGKTTMNFIFNVVGL